MKNNNITIRKMMNYINNPIEQGGFWLPNIQRNFVWSEAQIIKLFDSIMREYPIGTLMIWKTDQKVKIRSFITIFKSEMSVLNNYQPINKKQKLLVLDGQQRLQSLYVAFKGTYNNKELYLNVIDNKELENDQKYDFRFLENDEVKDGMINVKSLLETNKKPMTFSREIVANLKNKGIKLSEENIMRINDIVEQFIHVFSLQEVISYQELDSVDNNDIYDENDIVEIFIRSNSGGTKLEKSDLLFALLTKSIDDIEEKLEELINELNCMGYKFSRDFILKTCLTLIGAGAKYDVNKFRKEDNVEKIDDNWEEISNAIKSVKDFIYDKTYIKNNNTLTAYTPLIPIIYCRYKYKDEYNKLIQDGSLSDWIIKVIFNGVYNGSSDSLIDLTVKDIEENNGMNFESLNILFKNQNKSLEVTEDNILSAGYYNENSKKKLYLLFNIWYNKFDFNPSFSGNKLNIDHIFPQSEMKKVKIKGDKGRLVQKYKAHDINQIGNCMLLSFEENRNGSKGDKLPSEWFKDKSDEYLDMHLIPKDKELWKKENFEKFIEERTKLIVKRIMERINFNN